MENKFRDRFGRMPVFGMVHLAGDSDAVSQAMHDISVYEEEHVDGVIVENYHGSVNDVINTLKEIIRQKPKIEIGINILPNNFHSSFAFAHEYCASFIQLDHVAGRYNNGELDSDDYSRYRAVYPETIVLGGVWPKYYKPVKGSRLEDDLKSGVQKADAIVVTGEGTGKETPIEKIRKFRNVISDYPLIVGAGLNLKNAYGQLALADGAIVGTAFKIRENTEFMVDQKKVHDLMSIVNEIRKSR